MSKRVSYQSVPPSLHTADNQLLRRMGPASIERLRPRLRPVTLHAEEVLYRAGDRISHIYFPTTAVLCMLTIMKDGRTIESATVGNEGASWVSASLGTPTMPCQTMVAVGGTAYKLAAKHVEEEIRQNGILHDLLTEYSHALLISTLRTGACNAMHSLSQRSARWLLLTLDRTGSEFGITHNFMAALLACSRTSLTAVLGELEATGGIHTRRGRIEIIGRHSLEKSTCECYETIRETYQELRVRAEKLASQAAEEEREQR